MDDLSRRIYELCTSGHSYIDARSEIESLMRKVQLQPEDPLRPKKPSEEETPVVAVLGLGNMGKGVAACLEQIYTVRKWNRSDVPERNADSIREACQDSSIVFTMLANDAAVRDVVTGREGVLDSLRVGMRHFAHRWGPPDSLTH